MGYYVYDRGVKVYCPSYVKAITYMCKRQREVEGSKMVTNYNKTELRDRDNRQVCCLYDHAKAEVPTRRHYH